MKCPFCRSEKIDDIGDIDHRIFYCEKCKKIWYGEDYD